MKTIARHIFGLMAVIAGLMLRANAPVPALQDDVCLRIADFALQDAQVAPSRP